MTEVFETRLLKIGNSLGVIIPNNILRVLGVRKGDKIHVAIPLTDIKARNKKILALVGVDRRKSAFKREKGDRY
jgi:antitoxin component of MazEF toxin-antitoxin module